MVLGTKNTFYGCGYGLGDTQVGALDAAAEMWLIGGDCSLEMRKYTPFKIITFTMS